MARWRYVVGCLIVGCTGSVGEPGVRLGPPPPIVPESCDDPLLDPGPSLIRRLTNAEYVASIEAMFGVVPDASGLPAESKLDGFDNQASAQSLTFAHVARYQTIAESVAVRVTGDAALRTGLAGCDPSADDACLRAFATEVGRRAYRREPAEGEIDAVMAIADAVAAHPEPHARAAAIVEGFLQSPKFLFKVELGTPHPTEPSLVRLTGPEIASRLSYFLHGGPPSRELLAAAESGGGGPPSRELLAAAESGGLDTADGVERVARELLGVGDARTELLRFASQWFRTDALAGRDVTQNPDFDASLRSAMLAEADALLGSALTGERPFLALYTDRRGWVNDALAPIYGVGASGSELVSIDFSADPNRGGFFTTAAFLTLTSKPTRTSPIHRGLYVRDAILCDPLPPPPPGIMPTEPEPGEGDSSTLERHSEDDACRTCHVRIDPIGFGLDRYDAIGRYRTMDGDDPVRTEGRIAGLPGDPTFGGGVELGAIVAGSELASECAVRHLFRWALARHEEPEGAPADACTIERLHRTFVDSGYDFRELVIGIVRSDAFRHRRVQGGR
jgi:hypothetical protein